jgi:hypothetical protein
MYPRIPCELVADYLGSMEHILGNACIDHQLALYLHFQWHHTAYCTSRRTASQLKQNAPFELCPKEVCLRTYLPSGIASHIYFIKWPLEEISVVVLMRLHRPGQWVFLSPEKLYLSSCASVLVGVRYVCYFQDSTCKLLPREVKFFYELELSVFYRPGSSVGIATGYGLDDSGIETRWGNISAPVQTGPGAHPASCTMGSGSFPRVKRPGRGADHPPLLALRSRKSRAIPLLPSGSVGLLRGTFINFFGPLCSYVGAIDLSPPPRYHGYATDVWVTLHSFILNKVLKFQNF